MGKNNKPVTSDAAVITPKAVASDIPVWCSHDALIDIAALIPNPRNPNKHPDLQIGLLAKIIRHQGWRSPITVSKRSGFITKGHGRLLAAKMLNVEMVPVDYQQYSNEAAEWADVIADNRMAELAERDLPMMKDILQEIDTGEFDMELTGFDVNAMEAMMTAFMPPDNPNDHWNGMPEFGQEGIIDKALTCLMRFKNIEDREAFEKLLGYKLSHKGKTFSAWFPKPDFNQLGHGMEFEGGEEPA